MGYATEESLDLAITRVKAGKATVEQELTTNPALRGEAEALLHLAVAIVPPSRGVPSPEFRAGARARLLAQAGNKTVTVQSPHRMSWVENPFTHGRAKMSTIAAAATLALTLALGAGAVSASMGAVPGDPLYGTKQLVEQVQLQLAMSTQDQTQARLALVDSRIREMDRLLEQDRLREFAQVATAAGDADSSAAQYVDDMSQGADRERAMDRLRTALTEQERLLATAQTRSEGDTLQTLTRQRERLRTMLGPGQAASPTATPPAASPPAPVRNQNQNRWQVQPTPVPILEPTPTDSPFGRHRNRAHGAQPDPRPSPNRVRWPLR